MVSIVEMITGHKKTLPFFVTPALVEAVRADRRNGGVTKAIPLDVLKDLPLPPEEATPTDTSGTNALLPEK